MPDSPARNVDVLRKSSLDPGTERLATKQELISLLENNSNSPTPVATKEDSAKVSESSSNAAQQVETANSSPKKSRVLAEPEIDTSALRATPIQVEEVPAGTAHVDLVELAAILDQHRIWVETGGDEGHKAD